MFVGAVPKEFISQILDAVPFADWGAVHVCCSGSFRPEAALRQRFPELRIAGNDVSLLSVAIGELAVGRALEFKFKDRLEPIEEKLDGLGQSSRVAAVLVAHEMATYRGKNPHAQAVFAHYIDNFEVFLEPAQQKIETLVHDLASNDFFAGDFRIHASRAIDDGAGILCFAPTYAKGYERIYKFLHDNVEWPAPQYDIWDPADLDEWVADIDRAGARYCVLADRRLDGLVPAIRYDNPSGRRTIFGYTDESSASLRGKPAKEIPFVYRPIDPGALTKNTTVSLAQVEAGLDGALAGGFIYIKSSKHPSGDVLYLLSDFSISRERRISKLIAAMATCRLTVDIARKRYICPFTAMLTTVFTDKPVSMKYRGVFDLEARRPGALNYRSKIRDESPDEIYRSWFARQA